MALTEAPIRLVLQEVLLRIWHKVALSVVSTGALIGLISILSPALFAYLVLIPPGFLFETTVGRLIPSHGGDHTLGSLTEGRLVLDTIIAIAFWLVAAGVSTFLLLRPTEKG